MSKGSLTRQRIIARAAPVFNVRGYAGTSLGDITQAAGLEKGGIYNHFASKEALALEAFDYAVDQIGQRFLAAVASHEHAVDKLLAVVEVFLRNIEDPPVPGGCPVLNTAIEADDTYPALRERAQAAMTGWLRLIGKTVKLGIERGELRPDVDPRAVASLLTSALEGALMLSKLYDDPIYMRRAADHLGEYLRSLAPSASSVEERRP